MNMRWFRPFGIAVAIIGALAACNSRNTADAGPIEPAAVSAEAANGTQSYRGWYMEHGGQGRFQACGDSQPMPVAAAVELSAKARSFGLEADTPVYVRLQGAVNGGEFRVSAVEQFGSPTPIRDCGMTGVVLPEPAPSNN